MQIFRETIAEILSGTLTIGLPNEEARHNTWSISIGAEAVGELTAAEVASFIAQTQLAYRSIAPDHSLASLRFYSWFDEHAGQLRFSVSSARPLPFGAAFQETTDANIIARQLLSSRHLDGIPWIELEPIADLAEEEIVQQLLVVYVVPLAVDPHT